MNPNPQPIRKPVQSAPAVTSQTSEHLAAYSREVEIQCEDCGGDGKDHGALDPFDNAVCKTCDGRCVQTVTRNYLSEAFAIVSNPDSTRVVEREHLVAITRYAREHVSALFQFPEVA